MAARKPRTPKAVQAKADEPAQNTETTPTQGEATPNTDAATAKDGLTQDAQQDTPPAAGKDATGDKDVATKAQEGTQGEIPALFVRTKRRIKSRRRAGHRFDRKGHGIALEALTDAQVKQLKSDPALEVEDCTFPADPDGEPEQ